MGEQYSNTDGNQGASGAGAMTSQIVSIVANAAATAPEDATVGALLDNIKNGKWRTQVEHIRSEYRRAERQGADPKAAVAKLKKALPGILWSGKFRTRKKDAPIEEKLVQHSGLLCADIDDVADQLDAIRAKLITSPYAVAVFCSPTGTGLKAIFRVAADAAAHLDSFNAVRAHVKELTGDETDPACKDATRLCFVSDDPDLWRRSEGDQARELPGCTQGYKDTEDPSTHTVVPLSRRPLASLSPCVLVYTWEEAIEKALPTTTHTSHKLLFKLNGALLAFEHTTKTKIADNEWREIFSGWYKRAQRFLNPEMTEEEYYIEFRDAKRNIKYPLTENEVDAAWKKSAAQTNPPEAQEAGLKSPNLIRFIAFCRELQILNGNKPFYLSPYTVMTLFKQQSHSTAASWLGGLCDLKILSVVERGDFAKRRATSYKFNFHGQCAPRTD
jgi:hypothetical protein